MRTWILLVVLGCCGFWPAMTVEAEPEETPAPPPVVKQLADGSLEIGGVRLDKKERSIRFPAEVNMQDGTIEYLLVGKGGKTHESAFATEISPYYLHLAMLLLGAKSDPNDPSLEKSGPPPSAINAAYLKNAPELKGDPVEIWVTWKSGKGERTAPAEDFIVNTDEKGPMRHGPWTYNGSMFFHGKFLATVDLSIVAMVTDPEALVNNRQPGHDNDQIWTVDGSRMPPVDTQVEIMVKMVGKGTR